MPPKVSVIIPNYNHSEYLRQRIDSVLNQTFRDFEVIILDDCSTDNSREIIESYRNHPVVKSIILNNKNQGTPFKQWKRGIDEAEGEWIWIAESDDYADENFLLTLISSAGNNQDIGIIYCDSMIVDDLTVMEHSFGDLKNEKLNTTKWGSNYVNDGIDEIENFLLPHGTINNTSAVLFKRNVLVSTNPFDLDLRYIGDKYAFLKVLSKTKILYCKDRLNYYRNPFTSKHIDKQLAYFHEHFLVFSWVQSNLSIERNKFDTAFYLNIRSSVYRHWNIEKLSLYWKLFLANPLLLLNSFIHNLLVPLRSR